MRKSFRALCVAVTFAVALLVLSAAPAFASETHVFSTSFGAAGSGAGEVSLVADSGVAVNATTHDVYVADTGNARVDQFSATGTFIRAWGWGVADGLPAFETCTLTCQAGTQGAAAGQFTTPTFIAVDNSGGASAGDVYVGDRGTNTVSKFSAVGAYISTNDGSGASAPIAGPFGALAGVTLDASGDLWVYDESGRMFELAQDGAFVTDWSSGRGVIPNGIDVDSAGNLYVLTGAGTVEQFSATGRDVGPVNGDALDPTGFALDRSNGGVYMDSGGGLIRHYESSCDAGGNCTAVDTFGAGQLNGAAGLAADSSSHEVFVLDTGDARIDVFVPFVLPDVLTGQAAAVTTTTATLQGSVNADSTVLTDCHFSYVDEADYDAFASDPYAAGQSVPCAGTPSGSGAAPVTADIAGLTPSTVYHFRLSAANSNGVVPGADQTFATTGPPLIASTSAINITSTSADLRAQVNPDRAGTTYHFEYGTSSGYGRSTPESAPIGSDDAEYAVNAVIQGLAPNTTYHYRVIATNSAAPGGISGPDHTITTQPSAGGGSADVCPNAAIRTQQNAAALPDCRAYEQVSPVDKGGSAIFAGLSVGLFWQASADGNAAVYSSTGPFADAQAGSSTAFPYLASRTQSGWFTHSLLPPQAPDDEGAEPEIHKYSNDLSKGILINGGAFGINGNFFGQDEPLLVPGEPANNLNIFLRDNLTNSYRLVDVTPPGVTAAPATLAGVSADLSHVFFTENAQLTADSPPLGDQPHLFEWDDGVVRLAGILPDGSPAPASQQLEINSVSEDGSRTYFRDVTSDALYLRQGGTTVQVDASHGPGPGGGGRFRLAGSDGSQAFFLDDAEQGLTSDTVAGSGKNLYRYEANSETLANLTPATNAEVLEVVGAGKDGSYVYFVANGVLASGAHAGNCLQTSEPAGETCNLYLFHDGVTTFIAALGGEDGSTGTQSFVAAARVSPDGRYLAFQSLNSLTGYDNLAANGVQCGKTLTDSVPLPQPRCSEVYLYDASAGSAGKLSCVSCNPSGGAPIGASSLGIETPAFNSSQGGGDKLNYTPHSVFDNGRLFFNSGDVLVPQDVNGQMDVYEYEPSGLGSCAQTSGCVALISSGRSRDASFFRDASVSGDDAFFTTSGPLVAQDGDQLSDLYDARVGGGIASQNAVSAPPCNGESCKAPASGQPGEQTPGSIGFSGVGNLTPAGVPAGHGTTAKKHPIKKKHRVKKKKRKQSKRHGGRARRANHNHGGAK
jgi:hypothetical protein